MSAPILRSSTTHHPRTCATPDPLTPMTPHPLPITLSTAHPLNRSPSRPLTLSAPHSIPHAFDPSPSQGLTSEDADDGLEEGDVASVEAQRGLHPLRCLLELIHLMTHGIINSVGMPDEIAMRARGERDEDAKSEENGIKRRREYACGGARQRVYRERVKKRSKNECGVLGVC